MEEILQNNKKVLLDYCEKGISGKFRLPVREISIPLTNRCNNYCIMCHACKKEHNNHTYFNEPPFNLSIEDYMKIIRSKKSFLNTILRKRNKMGEGTIDFVFGTAESLLNPNIYDICKYTKKIYPNSKIRLISNGTISPKDDIVRYLDRIGFSVDGATKETFEKLRPPAKFDHVLKTIEKWDESADKYNNNFSFGLGVVASSENINEICDIVRLAKRFHHIDSVYIQPVIIHDSLNHLKSMLLDNVPEADLINAIHKIETASSETGIRVDGLDSIRPVKKDDVKEHTEIKDASTYCRYTWNGILSLLNDGSHRYFCCYMTAEGTNRLKEQYKIPDGLPIEDLYNCKSYWTLRKDMLEGKLSDCCIGCKFADAGYNSLKETKVDVNKRCYY